MGAEGGAGEVGAVMRQGRDERGVGLRNGSGCRSGVILRMAALFLAVSGPLVAWDASADPMSFQVARLGTDAACRNRCVDVITAEGEIDNETASRFVGFLSDNLRDRDLRPMVLIESPGGTVLGAMKLGAVFRKLGAAVMVAGARGSESSRALQLVPADCLSACVYAFMGGKRRLVPPISRLGIHRMVVDTRGTDIFGIEEGERIYGSPDFVAALAAYTKAMGVDPFVIAYAEQVAPEQIHILSRGEIRRWRLGSARP